MNSLLPRRFHGLAADEMLVFRIVWQLSNICKWRTLIAHTHESHTHSERTRIENDKLQNMSIKMHFVEAQKSQ